MLAAMKHLVGEQIAAPVARGQPVDERPVGLDRAQRRRVILARRGEQLRTGAIMRSAQNNHQLRRLMRHQLVVRMRVGGGSAARVDMRRDQTRQGGILTPLRCAAGTFGRIEKSPEFEAQLGRVAFVAHPRQSSPPLGAGDEFLAHAPRALGIGGRIEVTGAIQRRDQVFDRFDCNVLAEALDERGLDIAERRRAVEQRDDEIRAHPEQNRFGRDRGRIAQAHHRLPLLLDGKGFDLANLRLIHDGSQQGGAPRSFARASRLQMLRPLSKSGKRLLPSVAI